MRYFRDRQVWFKKSFHSTEIIALQPVILSGHFDAHVIKRTGFLVELSGVPYRVMIGTK